jgi:hypothetical protein
MHQDWHMVWFILVWLIVGALAGLGLAGVFGEQEGLILTSP